MSTIRRVLTVGVFSAVLAAPGPLHGQSSPAERIGAAKALKCVFPTMAIGNWKNGAPFGEIKTAQLSLAFEDVDADEGTARALGMFGPSDIIVRLSAGTLHFVQSFREGPLYSTTVFPYESRPGQLRAVHTRHEFTEVSLPGFTSKPEQYYGECQITK